MIQSFGTIPATEYVHQTIVHNSSVSETNIRLTYKGNAVKHSGRAFFFITEHDSSDVIAIRVRVMLYLFPSIGQYRVFMYILKDLNLIPSSVHIEPILIPSKRMICPCLWKHGSIVLIESVGTLEFVPLLLKYFVLE